MIENIFFLFNTPESLRELEKAVEYSPAARVYTAFRVLLEYKEFFFFFHFLNITGSVTSNGLTAMKIRRPMN